MNKAFGIFIFVAFYAGYCPSAWAQWPQAPVSALFIGNSYTFYNDLPGMVRQMAAAAGQDLYVESYTPGGYTFQQHSTDATALSKIRSRAWDVVVLQEQSQRPSFPPSQVQNEVFPFARILADSIRSNHPCTRTVFYMTWGRENGDQQNCQFYPPLCTYAGMQERLRSSYIEMAEQNAAWTAPVGAAWRAVRAQNPEIMLYAGDQSHPSLAGSYLAACVIYSTIFGSPEYLYAPNLGEETYLPLQNAARNTVFDSLNVWKIGAFDPRAFAEYTVFGDSVVFQNLSAYAQQFSWDFGDGNTSFAPLPSHVYALPGDFTVTLTAQNACLTDVYTFTVTVDTIPNDTIPNDTIPNDTIPNDTIPNDTIPNDTIPNDTIPNDTIPNDTIPNDTIPNDTIPNDTIPNDTIPNDTIPDVRSELRRNGEIYVYMAEGGRWIWKSKTSGVRFRVWLYDAKGRMLATLDEDAPFIESESLPSGWIVWRVPGRGSGRLANAHEK